MSEPLNPTPPSAPGPVPSAPPPEPIRLNPPTHYLEGFSAKEIRMKESWKRAAFWLGGIFVGGVVIVSLIGELRPYLDAAFLFFSRMVEVREWPTWLPLTAALVIPAAVSLMVVQGAAAFLVWWERKVAGHMQGRLGPMDVGGWHGWAQTIADGIKLFLKELIEPSGVDKWPYRLAPLIVFVPAFLCFVPLPYGLGLAHHSLDIGLLYILAVSGLSTIGILMAGWGSANKYSLLGGLRAAAQIVSFEIPRVLSVIPVVMWAGTMNLDLIWLAQSEPVWGWAPRWFIFYPIVGQIAFVIYLVTTIAETNRVPFDLPEAESELTAGFHAEYGGMNFAIFFLSEYAYVFIGSLLGAVLFLGGGSPLFPFLNFIPSWAWMLAKTGMLMFVFLWARWTFPRLRVDRMMDLCWKIFIPWTLINVFIMGAALLWRLS